MQTGIGFGVPICGEAGLEFGQDICPSLRAAEDPVSRIPLLIDKSFGDRIGTHEKGRKS